MMYFYWQREETECSFTSYGICQNWPVLLYPRKKVVISVQMEQKVIACIKTWQICAYRQACTQHTHTPGSWPVRRETCLRPNPR